MKDDKSYRAEIYHPSWEAAIHGFQRAYYTVRGEVAPLDEVQRFHHTWYQNRDHRLRADKLTKCDACEERLADCMFSGEPFYAPVPQELKRQLAERGIIIQQGFRRRA